VTELGSGADTDSGLAVGQRVWGIAHGSLGTAVAAPAATLVAMPPAGDVMAFSALPTAFATAQQALWSVAGVRPRDTVLVHAAAGAVGLATLQARCSAACAFLRKVWRGPQMLNGVKSISKMILVASLQHTWPPPCGQGLKQRLLNLRAGPCLQVAAEAAACALATAGSPAKRKLLRRHGCTAVYSSRDTCLMDDVAMHGGVNVVVNSLTSPGAL